MSDSPDNIPVDRPGPPPLARRSDGWIGTLIRTVLALAILGGAGAIAVGWLTNRPRARRRRPEAQTTLVEVTAVERQTETVVIRAMGTVVPAREVRLAARVGGEIVEVAPGFVPGGRFEGGATIVRVDPKDYELAVQQQQAELEKRKADVQQRAAELTQRESAVTKADSDLAIEMGQQSVARREYELLGEEVDGPDKALMLRRPQLQIAKANCAGARAALASARGAKQAAEASLAAAQTDLEQAKLDLDRTAVRVPFNAVVRERHVEFGAQVSPGSALASLVGTETYWIQVLVPLDQLHWIRVPDVNSPEGSTVRIAQTAAWGRGVRRTGRVERLMADLEPEGRMARLLVAVEDPLDLKAEPGARHPLVLGSYVRVGIEGRTLQDMVCVPRTALHDGQHVWVMGPGDELEVREVTVVWAGNDHVCVREGLNPGDRLITSDLAAPVEGMALRAAGEADGEPTEPIAAVPEDAEKGPP